MRKKDVEEDEVLNLPWYVNEKGKVGVKTIDYINFLTALGIRIVNHLGEKEIVVIRDNIIHKIGIPDVIQMSAKWLEDNVDPDNDKVSADDIKEAWINKGRFLFDRNSLNFLKEIEFKQKFDTKDESYFYFLNVVAVVTKDNIRALPYSELKWLIWQEQIVNREFTFPIEEYKREDVPFAKFIKNIAGKEEERERAFISMIGYLLHRYQDPANAKAIMILDETDDPDAVDGGRGKSLIVKALGFMRPLVLLSGKNFNSSNIFCYQQVNYFTGIVSMDDVNENFRFDKLYNNITDGFTINVKYKPERHIPFEESPKIVITSNHIVKAPAGNSTDRRKYEIELSSYYGGHLTVFDDFGHYFFNEWTRKQWDDFTYYMLKCVQSYLSTGLVEAHSATLEQRRIERELGKEFIDFMEVELRRNYNQLHKKRLLLKFSNSEFVNKKFLPSQRTFTTKIKRYLQFKNIPFRELPLNTKTYFEIPILEKRPNEQKQKLTLRQHFNGNKK